MGSNPYESPSTVGSGVKPQIPTHGRAIAVALVQQAFILMIGALMLDGGRLLRAICVALVVSWLISLAVMLWHREQPTRFSAGFVKYGFWLAFVVLFLAGRLAGVPLFGV